MPPYIESPNHRRHRGAKTEKQAASGGRLGRIAAAMTSVAGIATAIATIMTSATAALGVVIHHQNTQLQQAHEQVSQQAQQIQVLQSSQAAQQTPTPGPSATASPTPSPGLTGVAHYLSNLDPTVNNEGLQNGQEVIAAVPYPNSIAFGCSGSYNGQPGEAYDVAGNTVFTAEVGLADNTEYVTGVIATVVFSNEAGQQLGKPVQVSLGHPKKVTLNISGLTQLGMSCTGRNAQTGQTTSGFDVAIGDAGIS
jgi:hypothetical protein